MMMPSLQTRMALGRLGQRFLDPSVEANYRQWRRIETFPMMWLGAGVAAFGWLVAIPMFWWYTPTLFAEIGWAVYGGIVPLFLLLGSAGFVQKLRPAMLFIVCVMHLVAGLYLILIGYWFGHSIGAAVSGTMLTLLFAPFMRLPPLTALLFAGPYLCLVTIFTLREAALGNLDEFESFFYSTLPFTGLTIVLVVCGVLEFLLRRSYTREQLILEQQRGLEESRRMIRRYIPPAVAEQIIAGNSDTIDTPQRRRVTVLFSDIVGFTDMADRLDAESLTQILNEYMSAMSEIVEAHNGTLNEFAGDGLMALFGAPKELSPEDQVLHAVGAAQKMQALLPELNKRWRKLGIGEPLQIRVGINTGVLSVGSFGSEGRMTYTAIGLQTNIASRIESQAAPGEVLLSDASYQLISDQLDCEPRGEVDCKGVHFPVKVYAPKGIAEHS